MSFAAIAWPEVGSPSARHSSTRGAISVWRWELAKLARLARIHALLVVCIGAPFVLAGAVKVQSAVPSDTLFGQWVHVSGFALPMVVLSFAGQWALPLLASVVAGDVFSAEDQLGTWKTVLTRSRTPGEIFTGKLLAALTFPVVLLGLLAVSSIGAGLLLGSSPIVGLSGQVVPASHALHLVALSWLIQLPPMLGFAAVAMCLSIGWRNSIVGIGAPVLLGLVFMLLSLVNLPVSLRDCMLTTGFGAWHGLWTVPTYDGPIWRSLIASAVWFAVFQTTAWLLFSRRAVRVSS